MYGALGSELSLIPLMAIAETVTAIGRMDIMLVKKTAEKMYPDALVVYGVHLDASRCIYMQLASPRCSLLHLASPRCTSPRCSLMHLASPRCTLLHLDAHCFT